MPLVYQQNINAGTKIAVWHITEPESFFLKQVPLQREISHWHKRLQHLAGRLLLKELFPHFPVSMIRIADTKKPFLPDEPFHFSISHCGNYAAAIVSQTNRVGIDVEIPNKKIENLQHKFMYVAEIPKLELQCPMPLSNKLTLYWSIKETVFKWWGNGQVDFKKDIVIQSIDGQLNQGIAYCEFKKMYLIQVHYIFINNNFLTWVIT